MGVGVEVYDESGALQFASDFTVLTFVRGATVPGNATSPTDFLPDQGRTRFFDLVVTGVNPVVAVATPGAVGANRYRGVGVLSATRSGSTWTYRILISNNESNADFTFTYWIFDVPQPVTSGVGAEAYDPSGVLVWSTAAAVLEPVNGFASGRRYAALHGLRIDLGESFGDDFNNPTVAWTYSSEMAFAATSGTACGTVNIVLANGVSNGLQSPNYPGTGLNGFGITNPTLWLDVTNLPIEALPDPGSPTVTVNATTRAVTTSATTNQTTTTPAASVTASGGTAPYTYQWLMVEGSSLVTANGASNSASFSTVSANQAPGTVREAVWRCRVQDAAGAVGYSPEVTFRHTVNQVDLVPDAITSLAVVNGVSNADQEWFGVDYRRITGIDAPVTLRVERYSYSGNADTVELWAVRSPDSVNWTNVGYADARGSELAYYDMVVNPGEYIGWKVRVATASGRRTVAMDVVVWNLSNPSGPNQISTTPGNTFVVDDDNNYSVTDITPNAISPSNQSNAYAGVTDAFNAGTYFTISGINTPIVLRFTMSGLNLSGDVYMAQSIAGRTTSGYTESFYSQGQSVDIVANNGDQFFVKGYVNGSGPGSASWSWTVTNHSAGVLLASRSISITLT